MLFSRLDSEANEVSILVMQRLHEDELVAHLHNTGESVRLNLPVIAIDDDAFVLTGACRIECRIKAVAGFA